MSKLLFNNIMKLNPQRFPGRFLGISKDIEKKCGGELCKKPPIKKDEMGDSEIYQMIVYSLYNL